MSASFTVTTRTPVLQPPPLLQLPPVPSQQQAPLSPGSSGPTSPIPPRKVPPLPEPGTVAAQLDCLPGRVIFKVLIVLRRLVLSYRPDIVYTSSCISVCCI